MNGEGVGVRELVCVMFSCALKSLSLLNTPHTCSIPGVDRCGGAGDGRRETNIREVKLAA